MHWFPSIDLPYVLQWPPLEHSSYIISFILSFSSTGKVSHDSVLSGRNSTVSVSYMPQRSGLNRNSKIFLTVEGCYWNTKRNSEPALTWLLMGLMWPAMLLLSGLAI